MTSSLSSTISVTTSSSVPTQATISPTSLPPPTMEVSILDSLIDTYGLSGTVGLIVYTAVGGLGLFVICVGVLCISFGRKRSKKRRGTMRMTQSGNMEGALLEESYNMAVVSHSKLPQQTSFTDASPKEDPLYHKARPQNGGIDQDTRLRGFSTSINESYEYVFANEPQEPEEGIYDNDLSLPDTDEEEEDIYDNDPPDKVHTPSSPIVTNAAEEDNIYDNDPTPTSPTRPPNKSRLPSITIVTAIAEEEENIYDNESPPHSANRLSPAVVITNEGTGAEYYESVESWTRASPSPQPGDSREEENIYDNDPQDQDSCSENEYLEITPMTSPLPKDDVDHIYD